MDMLNRIKSAVSSALPVGNPITGEFDILTQRASGGPGLLWKIFDAVQKSTKQDASVFLLEKRSLDRFSKTHRDVILEVLKKGVSQLTRLRHPKILSVLHPLEDSRESLAFATEPVFASLSNVLGNNDNLPTPPPMQFKDFSLYDVEIKYGLLQVLDGLTFLHSSVKMVHGNVCPESIFINKMGCWKIAGFDFCINNSNAQATQAYYSVREWDPYMTPVAQPRLNYLAPEYAMTGSCDTTSDMFSLGVLIYALHSTGRTPLDALDDWNTFKRNVDELKSLRPSRLSALPDLVRDHVKLLLNVEPALRPDTDQLSKIPFFEDVGAMTLLYLDMLVQKDNLQKSQFFKGLPTIISKLPKRVNLQRVLPSLSKECVNVNMVPFVLPVMLQISEQCSDNEEFVRLILPELIPLFKITEPIQVMLIFLQNMSMLLNKTPQADVRNHILPMITRALEAGVPQMQELCLNIIPTFANLVEYTSLKNAIVPRIRKLCITAQTLSIRVNCLVCLGKLLEHLDKWYVLDEVLPILLEIPSREPAVLMSILGIFKVMLSHKKLGITKEMLSNKVLPFLFPLAIDNGLNLTQFNAFIAVIKEMIEKVETEHRTKLEQLNAVQSEQRTLQKFAQESVAGSSSTAFNGDNGGSGDSMMDTFLSDIGFRRSTTAVGGGAPKGGGSNGGGAKNPLDQSSFDDRPSASAVNRSTTSPSSGSSLSMAEKEKLAREQELQKQLKSQPALVPQSSNPSSMVGAGGGGLGGLTGGGNLNNMSGPKDLTAMLTSNMAPSINNSAGGVAWGGASTQKPTNRGAAAPLDMSSLNNLLPMSSPMSNNSSLSVMGGAVLGCGNNAVWGTGNSAGSVSGSTSIPGLLGSSSSNVNMGLNSGYQGFVGANSNSQGMMGNNLSSQTMMSANLSSVPQRPVGNPFFGPPPMGGMGGNIQPATTLRPMGPALSNFSQLGQPAGFSQPMVYGQMQPQLVIGQIRPATSEAKPLSNKDIADFLG